MQKTKRFLQLDVKKNEEGEVTMCTILDTAINKGIEQGIESRNKSRNNTRYSAGKNYRGNCYITVSKNFIS